MFAFERPPELTGDDKQDLQNLREYIIELVDELEYSERKRGSNEEE
jgi:hypothetical protein